MKYIQGLNRSQTSLFPVSLDDSIAPQNEVRLIDAFVNSLKLEELGFHLNHIENGRPAYHPADLLKLFIYGYLNSIRSSRQLEKECKRNWGFDHIMTKKGIQRAESDVGLIFISYNLRRLINLIGLSKLLAYCKAIISLYFLKKRLILLKISISKPILVFQKKSIIFTQNSLKNLIFAEISIFQ